MLNSFAKADVYDVALTLHLGRAALALPPSAYSPQSLVLIMAALSRAGGGAADAGVLGATTPGWDALREMGVCDYIARVSAESATHQGALPGGGEWNGQSVSNLLNGIARCWELG